jgi:hypothetical protein
MFGVRLVAPVVVAITLGARLLMAQSADPAAPNDAQHHGHAASGTGPAKWTVAVDGAVFATFNKQGGRRGDTDFRSQNWLMTIGARPLGSTTLTLTGMVTAEPFTVTTAGYSEIFQEGETYRRLQMTDHQHPHDLFMQLAAAWTIPVRDATHLTFAGGPVGEATLGPVAFMHRASSTENPTAPLSHHVFDSTHIVTDVAIARVDMGILSVEGSVFHGREPDEHHYDLDFGRPDSWAARAWFRPTPSWDIQVSRGFLHEPEALEPGDQRRTSASVSWLRFNGGNYTALTAAVGANRRPFSTVHAVLVEATLNVRKTAIYARAERTSAETEILLFPVVVHRPHLGELVDPIRAVTLGAVQDVARPGPLAIGVGGDVTVYGVPQLLQVTHGDAPLSFHVFVRVDRRVDRGRMWNMTMGAHSMPAAVHEQSDMHH